MSKEDERQKNLTIAVKKLMDDAVDLIWYYVNETADEKGWDTNQAMLTYLSLTNQMIAQIADRANRDLLKAAIIAGSSIRIVSGEDK